MEYKLLDEATDQAALMREVRDKWHQALGQARIAVAEVRGKRPDADGHLWLGSMRRPGPAEAALHGYDYVLLLNGEAWDSFLPDQRRALVDHELSHAAPVLEKDGSQSLEKDGRRRWRTRRHDVEEFIDVVSRHGLRSGDLEALAKEVLRRMDAPLFGGPARDLGDVHEDDEEGAAP